MNSRGLVVLGLVLAFGGVAAHANLVQNVWRGLDLLATPSGSPLSTLADGTRINGARAGRLRIVPNGIGAGYQLEFDRTFGVDSRGRPETIRLGGVAELTLDGTTQLTLGYNGKGTFRDLHGDFTANTLNYNLRTTTGAQDAQLVGSLDVSNAFEVNPLGFYTVSVNVRNTNSQLFLDGVAARDQKTTNFDIGPISVRGNIYYDATLAVLTGLGVDTTDLEKVFPRSPADQIDQAIRDGLQQAGLVAGTSVEADTSSLLAKAVTDQVTGDVLAGLVATSGATDEAARVIPTSSVPEPGTLMLFASGGIVLWYWRRRA
jgi:hypothetical protein